MFADRIYGRSEDEWMHGATGREGGTEASAKAGIAGKRALMDLPPPALYSYFCPFF
jgi:hypothetical protein